MGNGISRHLGSARAFALGLFLSCLFVEAVEALPKTKGWVEVRSPHFTLYGNASERTTKKIAVDLERFREILGRMTSGFALESEVPTTVFVFKADPALKPYKQGENGETLNLSGYFLERPFRNYVVIDASAGSQPRRVVYHEFVHSMLHTTFRYLPVWLDEGLAEYYSTFSFREVSNTAEVGHPIDEHLLHLYRQGLVSTAELFATERDSDAYNEADRQGQFYAESWLLVHYLIGDNERRRHINRLLGGLAADPTTSETTPLASMGIDQATLTKELHAYLTTNHGHYRIDLGDDVAEVPLESRELQAGETLFHLGDLLVQSGPWNGAEARAHLQAALEQGGPRGGALGALGMLAEQDGSLDEAEKWYRQAVAVEQPSAEVLARFALFLVERFIDANPTVEEVNALPPAIVEARELLRQSLELDPDNVESLAALGKTYLLGEEDTAEGLRLLAKANAKRPYRTDILHNLACMLAKSGRAMAAWSLLESHLRPKAEDASVVRSAEGWILAVEIEEVQRLLAAEDFDGARAVLDRSERFVHDVTLRQQIAQIRSHVEIGVQDLVLVSDDDIGSAEQLLDRANEAGRLAREGRLAEALEILDGVVAECSLEQLCESLRAEAKGLREVVEHNRWVERFNEAVGLANAGRHKPAIEIFREVEREAKDDTLAESARKMIRQLGG